MSSLVEARRSAPSPRGAALWRARPRAWGRGCPPPRCRWSTALWI